MADGTKSILGGIQYGASVHNNYQGRIALEVRKMMVNSSGGPSNQASNPWPWSNSLAGAKLQDQVPVVEPLTTGLQVRTSEIQYGWLPRFARRVNNHNENAWRPYCH